MTCHRRWVALYCIFLTLGPATVSLEAAGFNTRLRGGKSAAPTPVILPKPPIGSALNSPSLETSLGKIPTAPPVLPAPLALLQSPQAAVPAAEIEPQSVPGPLAELTLGAEHITQQEGTPESVSRLYEKQGSGGDSSSSGGDGGGSAPYDAAQLRRQLNQKAIERAIEDTFELHRSNGGTVPEERAARLVARFEKIPAFPDADPADSQALSRRIAAITDFAKGYLSLKGRVNIYPPQTQPRSGAQIYKISEDGNVVAVLKIFKRGSAEVLRELGGVTTLQGMGPRRGLGLELAAPVKPLGAFRMAGTGQVAYLMEPARGQNVYKTIRSLPSSLERNDFLEKAKVSVRSVAKAIAELHDKGEKTVVSVEAKLKMVDKLMRYLEELRVPDATRNRGWFLSGADYRLLKSSIEKRSQKFLEAPSQGTVTHGDAHPGNFYFNAADGKITIIDVETTMESLDAAGRGIISRGADIGRFIEAIPVNNKILRLQLSPEKIADLQFAFISAYLRKSGIAYHTIQSDVDFYRSKLHIAALYSARTNADFHDLLGAIRETLRDHE